MAEPKKHVPKLLDELESPELKPADVRGYFLRGMEVLISIAEDATADKHDRFHALKGVESFYTVIAAKDFAEETVDRAARSQDKLTDEVRRQRSKPWETDDEK